MTSSFLILLGVNQPVLILGRFIYHTDHYPRAEFLYPVYWKKILLQNYFLCVIYVLEEEEKKKRGRKWGLPETLHSDNTTIKQNDNTTSQIEFVWEPWISFKISNVLKDLKDKVTWKVSGTKLKKGKGVTQRFCKALKPTKSIWICRQKTPDQSLAVVLPPPTYIFLHSIYFPTHFPAVMTMENVVLCIRLSN